MPSTAATTRPSTVPFESRALQATSSSVFSRIGADRVVWVVYCKRREDQPSSGIVVGKAMTVVDDDRIVCFDSWMREDLHRRLLSVIRAMDWGASPVPQVTQGLLVHRGRHHSVLDSDTPTFEILGQSFEPALADGMPEHTGVLGILMPDAEGRRRMALALAAAAVVELVCDEGEEPMSRVASTIDP